MPRKLVTRGRLAGGPALLALLFVEGCYTPPALDGGAMLREHRRGLGEGGPTAGSGLTEDQAVRLSMESSPAVQTARARVGEARGGVTRAQAFDNPIVHVDNSYLHHGSSSLDKDIYKLGLDLRVPLPSFADRPARIRAAEADVNVARTATELEAVQARQDVRNAYARASAAKAKAELFTKLVAIRREREETLAAAVQGGHNVAADLAAARVATGEAQDRLARAEDDLADAEATLVRALGSAAVTVDALSLPPMPACKAPPDDAASLEDRVLAASPKLDHLRASHQRAEEEARAEHLARIPRLTFVEVGYTHNFLANADAVVPGYEIEPRYYSWSVRAGVGVELPVWNWNRGKIEVAEARLAGESAKFRETLSTTVAGLHRSVARWRHARDRSERATSTTLPAAEEALRLIRQAVDNSRLPVTAALDAEEKLALMRIELVDDLLQCRLSEIDVEAALGEHP